MGPLSANASQMRGSQSLDDMDGVNFVDAVDT